jgi:hypothetical protein
MVKMVIHHQAEWSQNLVIPPSEAPKTILDGGK